MAGHVINPSSKFEDPTAKLIRSWVMSSDISHRIPLTLRLQPLRMRHITWPMHRGKFFPHIWNPWPRFAYSLYGATMTFKGRLLLAPPMLKLFLGWKFQSTKSGLNLAFLAKWGVNVKFWFCDPEKAHPCPKPRLLTYFASKFIGKSWLYVISWMQKNSRVNILVREVAHARKQNP